MEFRELQDMAGRMFRAGMGAEAIRDLLRNISLDELSAQLRLETHSTSGQKRKKATKRLRVVESFRKSGNRPEWMIMTTLPGAAAGPAADGAARRRPLRHVRPERPVSARHQPQQPPQAAARAAGA